MLTQVRLYASFALHFLRCGDFGTFNLGQTENSFHKTLGLGTSDLGVAAASTVFNPNRFVWMMEIILPTSTTATHSMN